MSIAANADGTPVSPALTQTELALIAERLVSAGEAVHAPLQAGLIAGGRSNLTYRLTDGITTWVMRTPPRVGRTPSAHDVAREYRVTRALAATGVPVARPVALCEDESLIGGPFAIAEFVPGRTIQKRSELDELDDRTVDAIAGDLVATLARLHRVDHVAVGLAPSGRPGSYAQRQLRRWSGQWELIATPDVHSLGVKLSTRLSAAVPVQRATSIVHGDYRIDNTLLAIDSPPPRVLAVVDWELSTIGDPVADVAMMCAYRQPYFDRIVGEPSAWTSTRLPGIEDLAGRYADAGGAALADWDFHLALAYFKVAAIAAGIDHRRRAGAAAGSGFDTAGESVEPFLRLGLEQLKGF